MGCGFLSSSEFVHLVATATGNGGLKIESMTPWVPCVGLDNIRALLLLRALSGNFQCRLAIQTAEVRTDKPNAWVLLDQMTTADRCSGTLDISANTAGNMYVRFGVAYNLSSGTDYGAAEVQLLVSYSACGTIYGSTTLQLLSPDTNTYYAPLWDWIPIEEVPKFRFGVIQSGTDNGFKAEITYRTATIEPEGVTVAWGTVVLDAFVTGDDERCTGDLTLPTASTGSVAGKMWVQPGIGYSSSGGGANGTVTVIIGGRTS